MKKKAYQNKTDKKDFIRKSLNLTDEQRVDKLLDLTAEIAVCQVLKQVEEQKRKEHHPEKEQ